RRGRAAASATIGGVASGRSRLVLGRGGVVIARSRRQSFRCARMRGPSGRASRVTLARSSRDVEMKDPASGPANIAPRLIPANVDPRPNAAKHRPTIVPANIAPATYQRDIDRGANDNVKSYPS